MQPGDYNSYYHHQPPPQFPNPPPNPYPTPSPPTADHPQNTYASAPPFTGGYGAGDYSQNYHQSYGQNTEHVPPPPPSAPSFTPPLATNPNSYSALNQPSPIHPPAPLSSYGSFDSTAPPPPYQQTQPMYYPPYDHPPPSSAPAAAPNPNPNPPYSSYSPTPYTGGGGGGSSYDKPVKFDQPSYGDYGRTRSDSGSDLYGKQQRSGSSGGGGGGGGYPAFDDSSSYGDGVYAYSGGKVEPYGSRGTAPKSSNSTLFDDYGRPISGIDSSSSAAGSKSAKIARAVPKADVHEDASGGVQKFRVKLLAETYGQTTTDVLCQVIMSFLLSACLIMLGSFIVSALVDNSF